VVTDSADTPTTQHLCSQSPRRGTGDGLGDPVPDHEAAAEGLRDEERGGPTGGAQVPGPQHLGGERRIAPKALDTFKTRIREQTCRTRGLNQLQIEELTPYLIGWRSYFGFCQTPRVLTNLEAWIRRRLPRLYVPPPA
jgi:hypothetical protein